MQAATGRSSPGRQDGWSNGGGDGECSIAFLCSRRTRCLLECLHEVDVGRAEEPSDGERWGVTEGIGLNWIGTVLGFDCSLTAQMASALWMVDR